MESVHKRQIGILGGNFNPIHNGHLAIAQKAYEQFQLDEIWIMPAAVQPLKIGLPVTPAKHRKHMIELAIKNIPYFKMCTYELDKQGVSYTCETLSDFCRLFPDTDFSFIMGADSIYTFEKWRKPELICSCARLLAACRHQSGIQDEQLYKKAEFLRQQFGARIEFIESPFYDISSTQIRELLSNDTIHMKEQRILPVEVLSYIRECGLYQ